MRGSLSPRILFNHPVATSGYYTDILRKPADLRGPDDKDGELCLTDGLPLESSGGSQISYEPLKKNRALFLEFATLEPTSEAVTRFANKYGLLGEDIDEPVSLEGKGCREDGEGDPVKRWFEEIGSMKEAVDTWWSAKGLTQPGPGGEKAAEHEPDKHSMTATKALAAGLRNILADRLSESVVLEPVIMPEWAKGLLGLCLRPSNLPAAMWLQFAIAVEEDKEFRQCSICDAWMEVTPESRRKDAKYCSNKCRTEAYRKRQAAARVLHEKGKSPAEIARELGTDVKTVRNWIGK